MVSQIQNCFDSHTHFLATGQVAIELSLRNLKFPKDIKNLKIEKHHFRGDWLVGFGWDHHNWQPAVMPTKEDLDDLFPDIPVFFSRVDGHSSWINSKAIAVLELDANCSGVLSEQEHISALLKLPDYSDEQLKKFLMKSGEIFNRGGFTHVRDLSMTYRQWVLQKDLCELDLLNIYCEGFITVESVSDLERGLEEFKKCQELPCQHLKIKGLKIFIDGSLGSQTAYLSQNYVGKNHNGKLLWSASDIKSAIAFCWRHKMEIAIHTIGDEAVHLAALCAREVSAAGLLGKIHLEHVQLLKPETIPLLKPLHVYIHMQPCHWLSDHLWLNAVIGKLSTELFQWEALKKNRIHVDFGTDSPIEPADLLLNEKAILESVKSGILKLTEDWKKLHAHSSPSWGSGLTKFDEDGLISVELDGKMLVNFR